MITVDIKKDPKEEKQEFNSNEDYFGVEKDKNKEKEKDEKPLELQKKIRKFT